VIKKIIFSEKINSFLTNYRLGFQLLNMDPKGNKLEVDNPQYTQVADLEHYQTKDAPRSLTN